MHLAHERSVHKFGEQLKNCEDGVLECVIRSAIDGMMDAKSWHKRVQLSDIQASYDPNIPCQERRPKL